MKKFFDILGKILFVLIILGILYATYYFYSKYYFDDFIKAQVEVSGTDFYREDKNFCIENIEYNDSVFYKKLEVEPNTGYRVSCKIKTENVSGRDSESNKELNDEESLKQQIGACISIIDTEEQSDVIVGNSDFKEVELIFNSKNRQEVNIAFRLGSIYGDAKGKATFSDIKVEKTDVKDNKWNIVCFMINDIDATLNGKRYKVSMTEEDKYIIKQNLERFKTTMEDFSEGKMDIDTECIEIDKPLKTLSYSEENYYYIEPDDVYDLIDSYVSKGEYDHIFIATRMGDVKTGVEIPVNEWIGLGGIRYDDIGFSNIRLPNDMARTTMYKYDIMSDTFPEEVFVHEFLHTLERNLAEYEDQSSFPALHDSEKYGYSDKGTDGLKKWYKDYMRKEIRSGNTYVGLSDVVYSTMPFNKSDFNESQEVEFYKEPSNIFVGIFNIIKSLFNRSSENPAIGTVKKEVITE